MSQHVHPRTDDTEPITRTLKEYQPRYSITAEVDPQTLTVRGKVELHYRNLSDDTLQYVYFGLAYNTYPPGELPHLSKSIFDSVRIEVTPNFDNGYCRIDTLYYNVAPLKQSPVMIDSSLMQAPLPTPLKPDEEGFFILVFETGITGGGDKYNLNEKAVLFEGWHPRICLYKDGKWYTERNEYSGTRPLEYGLYRINLQVDSAYTIIGAGHFLNEKEHYGFVPKVRDETVYVDILNQSLEIEPGKKYKPLFEKGYKKYHWRNQGVTSFPFMLGKNFIVDRSQTDGTLISAVYRPDRKDLWRGFVAFTAGQLIRRFRENLGTFPYRELIIISGSEKNEPAGSETFIIVPDFIDNPELLYVHLVISLARCWLPEILPDDFEKDKFREALAVFAAWNLLFEQYGVEGYRLAEKYEKVVREQYLNNNALVLYERMFKITPARLYMLQYLIGGKNWYESLSKFVNENQYRVTPIKNFYKAINNTAGVDYGWFFEKWLRHDDIFDEISLEGAVESERVSGGVKVSGRVRNESALVLPLEIGYLINRSDTLYDTLDRELFRNGTAIFTKVLPEEPLAVIIDPRHRHYDTNRGNNYYFFRPIRYRYYPPEDLFPAFRNNR